MITNKDTFRIAVMVSRRQKGSVGCNSRTSGACENQSDNENEWRLRLSEGEPDISERGSVCVEEAGADWSGQGAPHGTAALAHFCNARMQARPIRLEELEIQIYISSLSALKYWLKLQTLYRAKNSPVGLQAGLQF